MSVKEKMTTHQFKSEEAMLLKLLANSVYSNKEVFLRELLSNASDAMDKLRLMAKQAQDVEVGEQAIYIEMDAEAKTLTIRDTGIGMNEEDLNRNLGTIAHSGTRAFLQDLSEKDMKDSNLIGQFGIGFYSAFVVADRVEVVSRHIQAEDTLEWRSTGDGSYDLGPAEVSHEVGTSVILHLKESCFEFLEAWRIKQIIAKYSDHISWPIMMLEAKETEDDAPSEPSWEKVNQAQALWTQQKKDVSDEQYQSFYSHISHDPSTPLAWTHKRIEGKLDYTMLLYVPSQRPLDLWHQNFTRGLKLFVKRVFIMDDAEQLLPSYLRFIKGVVDTSALPLNVSREILQSSPVTDSIRSGCTKKILGLLKDMSEKHPERYQKFWDLFGAVLKEGVGEDYKNREAITELLCFASTESEVQNVTLKSYIERMQEGQEKIYFITGENYVSAKSSPHLEYYKNKGLEVLVLSDRVDEWLMSHLTEFDGKSFQDITRIEVDQQESSESLQEAEKTLGDLRERVAKVLEGQVKSVRFTDRLVGSPVRLVVDQGQMSAHLQRMLEDAGQEVPHSQPILEMNPDHDLIQKLNDETSEAQFADWSHLLLEQALLAEGGSLDNPAEFVARMNRLLKR